MDYEILVTETAENRFDEALQYLIYEKKNKQAACNFMNYRILKIEQFNWIICKTRYIY